MVLEFPQMGNGDHDRDHHKKTHSEAGHKMHDEVHGILNKIHHGIHQVHLDHVVHGVEHEAKGLAGSAKREINGTATHADKKKLETVGKVAATVLLPHVVIGGAIVKAGIGIIKEQSKHHTQNVHVEHHTSINHGDSKQ
jgi:hypothetical protein